MSAKTSQEYIDSIEELKNNFNFNNGVPFSTPPDAPLHQVGEASLRDVERIAVSYVLGQWFGPHKEQLVAAWVDRYFHCDSTTTSRIEGGHRRLKDWIGCSTGDLQSVISSCRLAVSSQMNEICLDVASEESKTPLALTNSFFARCIGYISQKSLYKLRDQYEKVRNEAGNLQSGAINTSCTGLYTTSFGILCWHKLKIRLQNNEVITPLDFHPFWHNNRLGLGYEYQVPPLPIFDPMTLLRGRTEEANRRAQAQAHMRLRVAAIDRILSRFDQVECRLRHCSLCT